VHTSHRFSLIAAFVAAVLSGGASAAHAAPAETSADDSVSEVVVTGTRVANRSQTDTLSPVDVLTPQQLAEHGTRELATALSSAAPSLDFPRPSLTDGTDDVRPAALRGLGPDETLVLVDGKRQHATALVNLNGSVGRGSAAVDLNTIPLAAIDRIEVLRDGASAQYGSDAIAGVINLHLREARVGGDAEVSYGVYDTTYDTTHGHHTATDGNALTASAWAGFGLGSQGFLTITTEFRDADPTSRGDYDQRVPPLPQPEVTSRFGDPRSNNYTIYLNSGLPLSGGWKAYGWLGFQDRDSISAASPRLASNANTVLSLWPDGFLPLIHTQVQDLSAAVGLKGDLALWSTDLSLSYGRNRIGYHTEHSDNSTFGADSQTSFYDGALIYDQYVLNLDLVRGFDVGLPAPLNIAWGLEARREGYVIQAGEPQSWATGPAYVTGELPGAQGFTGFEPDNAVNVARTGESLYLDLETHLTRDFSADVAVRGEHYSDFGSTATQKLALRYDFTPSLALRGTVSTGFRAPSLQQEYFTNSSSVFIGTVLYEAGTFPATSLVGSTLGGQPLKPEKSDNYSVGGVYHLGSFEATVDAYRIDIRDRIVLSENLNSAAVRALVEPYGVDAARFFINGVSTRTQGLDTVLHYLLRTDAAGKFDFSVASNLNKTSLDYVPTGTSVLPGIVLFARQNELRFTKGTPSNKLILGNDWSLPIGSDSLDVSLKGTRYGYVLSPGTTAATDVAIPPAWVVDLEVGAHLGEHLAVAVGADNLLDKYPPSPTVAQNPQGTVYFSSFSPYGFNGRFVFARASYRW
jgi:iron complex outermembrane receptor protein